MWDSTLTLSNVSLNVIKKCIQACCHCYLIMPCKIITPLILFFLGNFSLSPLCSSSLYLCIFQLWSKKFSMFWRCETPFSFLEMLEPCFAFVFQTTLCSPCRIFAEKIHFLETSQNPAMLTLKHVSGHFKSTATLAWWSRRSFANGERCSWIQSGLWNGPFSLLWLTIIIVIIIIWG